MGGGLGASPPEVFVWPVSLADAQRILGTNSVAAAEQTAAEEARGAGVVRFTVLVTATVAEETDLVEAERIVRARAGEARLHLRRMSGSQAAAFTAGLPAGVVLPVHASIPF